MTKKLLFAALIALFLGSSALQAQNEKTIYNVPKHAVSVQMPLNSRKIGIGARYSYQFTNILRFTVDTDWYYYTFPKGRVNTITRDLSIKSTANWGRQFDINANANLVFGDGNFNFYLIVGFYSSLGHSRIDKFLVDMYGAISGGGEVDTDDGIENIYYDEDEDGKAYIYSDRLDKFYTYGIGVNAGFGVELQTSERSRFFIEQQASIGLMMVWMPKFGWSYCF